MFHGNSTFHDLSYVSDGKYSNIYSQIIFQTTCPWILRYLATAVICNKSSRRNVMKDLIKVIQEESYTYQDPITSFIEDLYVNFDFDGAQQKLRDCETVLVNDLFLVRTDNEPSQISVPKEGPTLNFASTLVFKHLLRLVSL